MYYFHNFTALSLYFMFYYASYELEKLLKHNSSLIYIDSIFQLLRLIVYQIHTVYTMIGTTIREVHQ